ncbi:hypothetical protein [Rhodococcus opacus]|nr:hypothetical protein [Rhodococcus opacus]UNN05234.1 hypothetical protein MOO23_40160 [Rhodococcus opacus]
MESLSRGGGAVMEAPQLAAPDIRIDQYGHIEFEADETAELMVWEGA